ncbi:hypothetical protein ASD78_01185 [Lysobacter sp. Root667]|uniref:endonuclease/exonuclease/phosphatase family protein n=1 Tax=Lysobacter sp. Root667 TaxID=1736581 RepID=UPI0006FCE939|nr:endonuclease/exonuclease/phosphatase family protein [Lysobacter sp. Root667]KRA81916.1 hypothetical protein ASD78_01185 [Lysobacter sp. Root667]
MRIVTWNAQGAKLKWGDIRKDLRTAKYDMMLVQEASTMADWAAIEEFPDCRLYDYKLGSRSRPRAIWYILHRYWAKDPHAGNPRCSLMILLKNYRPARAEAIALPALFDGQRPLLGVKPGQGMPWIFNLHATSGGGGADHAKDAIVGIKSWIDDRGLGEQWLLAGDFNAHPDYIDPGHDDSYRICPPDDYTHPALTSQSDSARAKLDYAVFGPGVGGSAYCKRHDAPSLASDHYPQCFDIEFPTLFARAIAL